MTDSTPDQGSTPEADSGEVNALTPEQVHATPESTDPAQATDQVPAAGQTQNPDQAESSGQAETPAQADSPEEADPDEIPSTEELEEPSTEKTPGEQPKAPKRDEPEPDHEAVGIGIVESEEPQAG